MSNKTASVTPAQQKVLDNLKAGMHLSMHHTKYLDGTEMYHLGGFAGQRKGVPYKTILSLVEKGLIKEASRQESEMSTLTDIVVYELVDDEHHKRLVDLGRFDYLLDE